nr:MAG TPA: hypothetical protein [Caudoviricetes sp.]
MSVLRAVRVRFAALCQRLQRYKKSMKCQY